MRYQLGRVRDRLRRTRAPSGLVSLSYVRPDPLVRLHRHLLAVAEPRIPRTVYWPMQAVSYARFVGGGLAGRSDGADDDLRVVRCRLRRRHTIDPLGARRFGLDERPGRWPLYIYDREAGAFHAMRNRLLAAGPADELRRQIVEIQDKAQTSATLDRLGITTALIHRATRAGEVVDLRALVEEVGPVFCKPRTGSRGQHSFTAELADGRLRVRRYQSTEAEQDGADYARYQFRSRPYLIQEHLRSHHDLVPPGGGADWDVVTVRLITHSPHVPGDRVYSAILELPMPISEAPSLGYHLSILDPLDGAVLRPLDLSGDAGFPAPGTVVPNWPALLAAGLAGHEAYPSIYAIAWDFAITLEAPVLLEGNTGWGVEIPQMAHGPLLRHSPMPDRVTRAER